nr:MAG TPA: hypothetical protein [Caudoviricetes sp.]
MLFPNNDYLTFTVSAAQPVQFSFPNKKPKKIWLDVASTTSFRFKINNDETGMLIHMNSTTQKEFKIPSTVNSISISTTVENSFYMTILVEEWGN